MMYKRFKLNLAMGLELPVRFVTIQKMATSMKGMRTLLTESSVIGKSMGHRLSLALECKGCVKSFV
jgi:hypothetical protein